MTVFQRTTRVVTAVGVAALSGLIGIASATAVGAALTPANYSGNPCTLVSARLAASVYVTAACTRSGNVVTAAGTAITARLGKLENQPWITLEVLKPSASLYSAAIAYETNVVKGKSAGVGAWSRTAGLSATKNSAAVAFSSDGYIAVVGVYTGKHQLKDDSSIVALARSISSQL